jgi:aerobic-type carbon monoxide dehydrogenase small subunit (CoxS/CutS family)
MNVSLQFILNGKPCDVSTDTRRSLLEVLREDLHLTGAKFGCGEGQCRACTVLIDGVATSSCVTPATAVAKRRVETIEGLARDGALHPVQEAFLKEGAMQCGYCVPGMILATVALLRHNPAPSRDQIDEALNRNLCRCCGYVNIVKAVQRAAALNPQKEVLSQ